jgi:predicted DNA-binding transcriptional regulator AlpA
VSRRALWSPTTPGADPAVANGTPQSPTAAPGAPLPLRSALAAQVKLARLADALVELAEMVRAIAQESLAVRAQEALMCSVSEPAAPARLLTAEDLAARLQVDARTIRRWRKAGKIPRGIEFGNSVVRWREDEIERWLESGGAG